MSNHDYEITNDCQSFICLPVFTHPVVLDVILEDVLKVNRLIQGEPSSELDHSVVGSPLWPAPKRVRNPGLLLDLLDCAGSEEQLR